MYSCVTFSRGRLRLFEGFSDYLRRERGLAPTSIIRHLPFVRRFLREVCPAGKDRSPDYRATIM
jgi:hypothetical protein